VAPREGRPASRHMKLLIVDDHPLVREGLAALLQQASPSCVVLQASDPTEGLDALERHPDLDVALVDLALPGIGGMAMIREFNERRPALPVAVLSSSEDPDDVRLAFTSGARGYLAKSIPRQTLLAALQFIQAGNRYVPEFMLWDSAPMSGGSLKGVGRLTGRQLEVLQQMAAGLSNKEIAAILDLSEKTVKAHVTEIFRTLAVANRTQAIAAGRQQGLI
jgi:two-component system, NarL family, nitrate/nitrite response regulator NarL